MTVISIGTKAGDDDVARAAAAEGWMSVEDAVAFLASTRTRVYELMKDDTLVSRKSGRRRVLLRKSVREYAERIARGLT